jgi:hypothetical protein
LTPPTWSLVVVDARDQVEELLASRIKDDGQTREFDVTVAIAALDGDEAAVAALLEAEATRRKRPRLNRKAQVDTVGTAHLQRAADAVCELPHAALMATLERVEAFDATNAELPIEQLAIRFWTAVFPELSAVEFIGQS